MPVPKKNGQSLIEVIVAMAVAILIVGGLLVAVIVAVRNSQFAKSQVLAAKYASEGMEKVRAYRDRSTWNNFTSGCGSFNYDGFTPTVPFVRNPPTCSLIDPNKIKVTVTVSWTDTIGAHKSELVSYFTKTLLWK